MDDYRAAFQAQRAGAKKRGIGWELTYQQWLEIWMKSGKLNQRGSRRGQYVMARNWDAGPYAEWNVDIQPVRENMRTVEYRRQYRKVRGNGEAIKDFSGDPLEILINQEESGACNL